MSPLLWILVIGLALMTAYVLVRGVIAMASGKDAGGAQQQQWMRKRIFYQALAVFAVLLLILVARPG